MDAVPSSSTRRTNLSPSPDTSPTHSSHGRPISSSFSRMNYGIGVLLLLVVVFLWTTSNFVTQDLFQDGYEKAFLVTYLNTSAFSLYLLPSAVRLCLQRSSVSRKSTRATRYESIDYQPLRSEDTYTDNDTAAEFLPHVSEAPDGSELPPLTIRETADLAFIFCFIWFAANWTLNASLDYTSVASATILSSTSGFFTLGISRIFQVETLTPTKIGAVCTSFLGVVLVALSDSSQTSGNVVSTPISTYLLGDLLALFSAVFYAFYVILLKVRIRSESRIDMKLFFGFVGLFNIISCWPIGVILHFAGVEKFELPSTNKAIGAILVNMAITWSSDYLYVLAMLKTTPLVVTIGLSLTIPLAVVGDFFLSKPTQLQVLAGALLVLISFVVVGVDDVNVEQPEKDRVDESQHLLHSNSHDRQRPVVHVNVEVDSDMH